MTKILKGAWVTVKESILNHKGEIRASRPITDEETAQWYQGQRDAIAAAIAAGEDTFSIARDSAGESRLPPKSVSFTLHKGIQYKVAKARCRVALSYGNATAGMTALLDPLSGETVYIKRHCLEVAGTTPVKDVELGEAAIAAVETYLETKAMTVSKDEVDAYIPHWLERVNEWRKERHTARCPNLDYKPVEIAEGGRKYTKVVYEGSVYCFIERATGEIYKARSYKTPETNFARGSIFVKDITHAVGDYGANYAT